MKTNQHIKALQYLASVALLVALFVPTALQFSHIFESHEHPTCKEFKTHVHEQPVECSFEDYMLPSFNLETAILIPEDLNVSFYKSDEIHTAKFIGVYKTAVYLRGPPSYS